MKNRILNICMLTLLSVVLLSSCNDWLDVKSADKVLENEMFESQKGYQIALNGVYIELIKSSLYGDNLSAGMIDVMAQYYKIRGDENHGQRLIANYNYLDAQPKGNIENIWNTVYKLIININTIINKAEEDSGVLSESYKEILLGECYGLRAMLHFDLMRLFGPIYSLDKDDLAIPYQTETDFRTEDILSGEVVMKKVLEDFDLAISHLENDPVKEKGATFQLADTEVRALAYRQQRMNVFAASALKARALLWVGDNEEALSLAKDIISKTHLHEPVLFPFTAYADATNVESPDRFFSSGILFGLYNSKKSDIHSTHFSSALSSISLFTMFTERIETMFDDDNDFRRKFWSTENIDSKDVNVFNRFEEVDATGTAIQKERFEVMTKYIMSAIRMSEIYLIAAEATNDNAEAVQYVNALRNARNSLSIDFTSEEKRRVLTSEYRREFLGEGQMYFYYKRNAFENLPNGGDPALTFNMALSNYVFPLPDSETSQRN